MALLAPLVQARSIDKHHLVVTLGLDTQHPVPRGLRLARGDADLLAQHVVQQGRLAHIGPPDDRHIAAALAVACASSVTEFSTPARRRLLGPRRLLPVPCDFKRGASTALHRELLAVIFALLTFGQVVFRQRQSATLQVFLQAWS